MRIADFSHKLARAVRWHRRGLAAVAAACAAFLVLTVLQPAPPTTVPVVVCAQDLAAGHTLTASDLRVAQYPEGLAPTGALSHVDDATGRVIGSQLAGGTPVTATTTISATLTPARGELLVPFHVADTTVLSLLQVGDLVTVVSSGQDGQPVTLATRVRVAALPQQPAGGALSQGGQQGLVVVAADTATATRLAAWSNSQGLALALG